MLAQVVAAGQVCLGFSVVIFRHLSFMSADRKGNGIRGIPYHLHRRWYFRVGLPHPSPESPSELMKGPKATFSVGISPFQVYLPLVPPVQFLEFSLLVTHPNHLLTC